MAAMRWLSSLAILVASAAAFLIAQTAPPNDTGISIGHIHLVVPDAPAMQKLWVDVMGGETASAGPLQMVKFPGVFIIVSGSRQDPTGGTVGSAVDHIGFSVKSFAATKAKAEAAGLAVQELTPNVQAFITFPNDVRVEIQEDTALTTPTAFSHYHLSAPDTNAAREWYMKTFGAAEGERRPGLKGAQVPGGFIDFLGFGGRGGKGGKGGKGGAPPPEAAAAAPAGPAATKGRALDHIGFEVKDLKAFTDRLVANGQKMDMAYNDMSSKLGLKIAFITDPNGTYIELTEGLNAK
jgi:catechol 2,3-dioxygenase-like lactoylglutathione lyase family enzyme